MTDFKFKVDEHVRKVGGSYQATGTIKSAFLADDGTARYVFRFDNPPGLLHIFNEGNLEKINKIDPVIVGLTEDQQLQILGIMGELGRMASEGTPGMAIAQVFDDHMRVELLSNEQGMKIKAALGRSGSRTITSAWD
ncbi:MAG: hypothetical protein KDJ31_02965 [Candidatus Competibacteraceae bacterium]|nr:hypothetical protein [Candidatus Competibacteraceae bacterium]